METLTEPKVIICYGAEEFPLPRHDDTLYLSANAQGEPLHVDCAVNRDRVEAIVALIAKGYRILGFNAKRPPALARLKVSRGKTLSGTQFSNSGRIEELSPLLSADDELQAAQDDERFIANDGTGYGHTASLPQFNFIAHRWLPRKAE